MKWLIKVIFKAVKLLINLILLPLDLIVEQFFPDLTNIISSVNGFFTSITSGILWVKSWLPFTSVFYYALVAVITFNFMVPFTVHAVKLVVKWYNTLKP